MNGASPAGKGELLEIQEEAEEHFQSPNKSRQQDFMDEESSFEVSSSPSPVKNSPTKENNNPSDGFEIQVEEL